jgi:hypothetical protein
VMNIHQNGETNCPKSQRVIAMAGWGRVGSRKRAARDFCEARRRIQPRMLTRRLAGRPLISAERRWV